MFFQSGSCVDLGVVVFAFIPTNDIIDSSPNVAHVRNVVVSAFFPSLVVSSFFCLKPHKLAGIQRRKMQEDLRIL